MKKRQKRSNPDNLPMKILGTKNAKLASRNFAIARDHLDGLDPPELAKKHGISVRQVYNVLSDEGVQAILNHALKGAALATPNVIQKLLDLIEQEGDKKVSLGGIQEFNRMMGLSTTHAPIANTLIVNQKIDQIVAPEMLALLKGDTGQVSLTEDDSEVIEGQFTEGTE